GENEAVADGQDANGRSRGKRGVGLDAHRAADDSVAAEGAIDDSHRIGADSAVDLQGAVADDGVSGIGICSCKCQRAGTVFEYISAVRGSAVLNDSRHDEISGALEGICARPGAAAAEADITAECQDAAVGLEAVLVSADEGSEVSGKGIIA